MLIGAHVREDDPVATAAERGADIVQMFLADPQGWKKPPAHPQAEQLRDGRARRSSCTPRTSSTWPR